VPEIFRSTLFWPESIKKQTKKRRSKEKIPSVATSAQWQAYHTAKATEKFQKLVEMETRKKKRQENAIEKKRIQEEARLQRVLKKEENNAMEKKKTQEKTKLKKEGNMKNQPKTKKKRVSK